MEASKKRLIVLAFLLITATALGAGAQQLGFFSFVDDLTGLIEVDRRVSVPFFLENLPEFFQASVIVGGSGYTGQPHTISIQISHNRPDFSVWIASGNYSLDLEFESNTTIVEPITSGSFTDISNTEPYVSPPYSWTPESPNGTYKMVLSIIDLVWTIHPEYTITATAGTGGSITDPGANPVLKGYSQGFTITPDDYYGILDVMVDDISVDRVSEYIFVNVQANHTIHANFALYTFMDNAVQTAYAEAPIWWDLTIADSPRYEELYDTYTYLPGDTMELKIRFHITSDFDVTSCDSYTYSVVIERVGGGDAFTPVSSTTVDGPWGLGTWFEHYHDITAPVFGDWFANVTVTDITWTP